MHLEKIELCCPFESTPKTFAKQWIKNNGVNNGETLLLKVTKTQPTNRAHSRHITRTYFYLFNEGKCILSNVPGMDRLFEQDTFEYMIFRAKFKILRPKRLQRILEVQQQLMEICM